MKTILIVEDDLSNLEVMTMILQQSNFEVKGFSKGEGFILNVMKTKPDLIIIDVLLNGEDGKDLCKLVKANDSLRHIPTLMTSTGDKSNLIADCKADGYIEKPYAIEDLIKIVNGYLFLN